MQVIVRSRTSVDVALLLLMHPHIMHWSQASSGAAGHPLCRTPSDFADISGVASMPEQGENEKGACVVVCSPA